MNFLARLGNYDTPTDRRTLTAVFYAFDSMLHIQRSLTLFLHERERILEDLVRVSPFVSLRKIPSIEDGNEVENYWLAVLRH